MNGLANFEQFFYRTPIVESVTTGGHFELTNISDEEKRAAEEYIHVCRPVTSMCCEIY
jgi:hypothetical protein